MQNRRTRIYSQSRCNKLTDNLIKKKKKRESSLIVFLSILRTASVAVWARATRAQPSSNSQSIYVYCTCTKLPWCAFLPNLLHGDGGGSCRFFIWVWWCTAFAAAATLILTNILGISTWEFAHRLARHVPNWEMMYADANAACAQCIGDSAVWRSRRSSIAFECAYIVYEFARCLT